MKAELFAAIPSGTFRMGAEDGPHPEDGEGPVRSVSLSAFSIARATVTNADFRAFADATGYLTDAERAGQSFAFAGQLSDPDRHNAAVAATPWWRAVSGANWRAPIGDGPSDPSFPVVHVSWADAQAYCDWSATRLPSEAEWERAAAPAPDNPHIWRGQFPGGPDNVPGPVAAISGQENRHGLYHACGNVWEWVADRFTRLHGPRPARDPTGPLNGTSRVVKGGSFLCCPSYCARFRPSSRRAEHPGATASNLGFRVAISN